MSNATTQRFLANKNCKCDCFNIALQDEYQFFIKFIYFDIMLHREHLKNFSNYIIYVDESGDHALNTIDKDYPVFVMTFSIFSKNEYVNTIVPLFQQFKFKYFGHDIVIFHENDIRRRKNKFKFLFNKTIQDNFINELTQVIDVSNFTVISTVIHKEKLKQNFSKDDNPYHIALKFCLERLKYFLDDKNQMNQTTHIVFEKRRK